MPSRIKHPCNKIGCQNLTIERYCEEHKQLEKQIQQRYDKQRGSAHKRGYTREFTRQSQLFIKRPENMFCRLRLKGCTGLSQCTDHKIPVTGPDDPNFWNKENWQPACSHCNRAKGNRILEGNG